MKAAVYSKNESVSTRIANDISRYLYQHHPEYYAKIMNFVSMAEFEQTPGSYGMDLYVLELTHCNASDAGFNIAKRLRDQKVGCAIAFIVPSEYIAFQVTREMLLPSYIFIDEAPENEMHTFLNSFLSRSGELTFMEFTFQYKKWLVNIENINYIQTCGNRVILVCQSATLESTERLTDLERRLPAHFFRVDKGCLINIKQLTSANFTDQKAMFGQDDFVYMSRRGAKKLQELLSKNH